MASRSSGAGPATSRSSASTPCPAAHRARAAIHAHNCPFATSPADVPHTPTAPPTRPAPALVVHQPGGGTTPPTVDMAQMHPAVWGQTARLWRDGHYRQAVSAAADAVVQLAKSRTGRNDIPDTSQWQQAFSKDDPQPGKPRLRWPGHQTDQTVKSMNEGLRNFAPGAQMTIRNPGHPWTWRDNAAGSGRATIGAQPVGPVGRPMRPHRSTRSAVGHAVTRAASSPNIMGQRDTRHRTEATSADDETVNGVATDASSAAPGRRLPMSTSSATGSGVLASTGEGVHEILPGDSGEPIVQRGRGIFTRKLKIVCGTCNHGWMSGIEEAAKPLLVRMFGSQSPISLSADDQLALARWAFKTAVVARYVADRSTFPTAHRREFGRTNNPPQNAQIWIGAASVPNTSTYGELLAETKYEPVELTAPGPDGSATVAPAYRSELRLYNVVFVVMGYVADVPLARIDPSGSSWPGAHFALAHRGPRHFMASSGEPRLDRWHVWADATPGVSECVAASASAQVPQRRHHCQADSNAAMRPDVAHGCACPISRVSPRSAAGPCRPGRCGSPTVAARSMTAVPGRTVCRRPRRWA